MEQEKIKKYVTDLLEVCGLAREGEEERLYDMFFHLLTAAAMCDLLDADEKKLVKPFTKKLQYFFATKISLKERKRKDKKEIFPPNPLLKKKEDKEKEEKTTHTVDDVFSKALDKRKEVFRQECLSLIGEYEAEQVTDFYLYWAEESTTEGKMRWETQKTWNTNMRMKRWNSNSYTSADSAAKFRLKKVKQLQQKEQVQKQIASEMADIILQRSGEASPGYNADGILVGCLTVRGEDGKYCQQVTKQQHVVVRAMVRTLMRVFPKATFKMGNSYAMNCKAEDIYDNKKDEEEEV